MDRLISIPVTGNSVPDKVKRIEVEVEIAGKTLKKTVDALPNQEVDIAWDGLDLLGNPVTYKVTAHIRIGYVYDSVYMDSAPVLWRIRHLSYHCPTREEAISWMRSNLPVDVGNKGFGLAKGWAVSALRPPILLPLP